MGTMRVPGLGDYVALALRRIGITKQRWLAWKSQGMVIGSPSYARLVRPGDYGERPRCGCDQRQALLNSLA